MALNIPNVGQAGESLLQGINTGSSMFSRLMTPVIAREQLAQQMKIHQDALALQKATQARLAAMAPLQRRLAELNIQRAEMETDPAKKMAYINTIMQGIHGMNGQGGQQTGELPGQPMIPFAAMGMPSQEEIDNPTPVAPSPQTLQQGGFNFTPEQQMALGMAGIKIPTPHELPEQKRFAELENKIKFEQQKTALKKKALEDKEMVARQW